MTEQYQQQNINMQGGSRFFTATVTIPNLTLAGSGDQFIQVNSNSVASAVILPLASEAGGGARVTILKTSSFNTVTPTAQGGDSIAAAAGITIPLTDADAALTLISDGVDTWYVESFSI